jgi:two-component system response regulator YesN
VRKMLIVDDDVLELESLTKLINWAMIDVTVIGTATNGLEALNVAMECNPHIVISDIKMPVMDGLELARQLYSWNHSIKTILFSAYDEFEYARKALNLNVLGYALKPIQVEELLYLVKQAVDRINEEQIQRAMYSQLKTTNDDNRVLMEDSVVRALLFGDNTGLSASMIRTQLEWILDENSIR